MMYSNILTKASTQLASPFCIDDDEKTLDVLRKISEIKSTSKS